MHLHIFCPLGEQLLSKHIQYYWVEYELRSKIPECRNY